jgi:hypothetical protein
MAIASVALRFFVSAGPDPAIDQRHRSRGVAASFRKYRQTYRADAAPAANGHSA